MTTITDISRASIKLISARAEGALRQVAEDLGLFLEVQGGKFDPAGGTFTPKFVFSLPGADRLGYDRDCQYVQASVNNEWKSLLPTDYGVIFTCRGETYKLIGVNLRAPKYPVLGQRTTDGKTFKFGTATVRDIIENRSR